MGSPHGAGSKVKYWAQWFLLNVYGSGQLDRPNDPVEQLKRENDRPEAP